MRILIYSPAFLPQIGGLEINTGLLAGELVRLGQDVTLITRTPANAPDGFPFRVVRNPSALQLLHWTRWSEVVLFQNLSLRCFWPLLLAYRPWAVSHHSWYCRTDGRVAWQDRLKRWLTAKADASIAVSQALADDLTVPSLVIANPYRDDLFRVQPGVERTRDIVFIGRLVSDKGVDTLLDALALLDARGLRPTVTVVGDGPERPLLTRRAAQLGLAATVEFLGTRRDDELVDILNRHRIMAVPSRYNEPFGIVALEGIACGCVVVGSEGGGLKEAIGSCGLTFRNGDAGELAAVLERLLRDPGAAEEYLRHAREHLDRHRKEVVVGAYLHALERAMARAAGARRR
jgi:glycogen synthase